MCGLAFKFFVMEKKEIKKREKMGRKGIMGMVSE